MIHIGGKQIIIENEKKILDALMDLMGINELGFKEEDGSEIIISKKIGGVGYFLGMTNNGKHFIYRKDSEAMLYPEDYGYFPIETKKEIYLRPKETLS